MSKTDYAIYMYTWTTLEFVINLEKCIENKKGNHIAMESEVETLNTFPVRELSVRL
jgi:hypothetical protein